MNNERKDVYSRITSQIVASLELGVRPWIRPWNAEHAAGRITRPLRHNGQPYCGINVLALWASAMVQNFSAPIWLTYRQARELGAHVLQGDKGSPVVFANSITRAEHDDATGQDAEREIPYMKGYTVFNVEQIDGLPEIYYAKAVTVLDPVQRIERAEAFVQATHATVKHGGNRAYYAQELDYVQMPPFEAFRDGESYYGTILHELVHSTRHRSRLDRDLGRKSWGDAGYAAEELVAELGSAFLCADLELAVEPRDENASYIAIWLEVLKHDSRAIFTAASHAQRAADYLNRLQEQPRKTARGGLGSVTPTQKWSWTVRFADNGYDFEQVTARKWRRKVQDLPQVWHPVSLTPDETLGFGSDSCKFDSHGCSRLHELQNAFGSGEEHLRAHARRCGSARG